MSSDASFNWIGLSIQFVSFNIFQTKPITSNKLNEFARIHKKRREMIESGTGPYNDTRMKKRCDVIEPSLSAGIFQRH